MYVHVCGWVRPCVFVPEEVGSIIPHWSGELPDVGLGEPNSDLLEDERMLFTPEATLAPHGFSFYSCVCE